MPILTPEKLLTIVRNYALGQKQRTDQHLAFFARKMVREKEINNYTEIEITHIVNAALSAEDEDAWYRTPMSEIVYEPYDFESMTEIDVENARDIPY